jgi:glycosyltransferase involved in cell wall biosynthesis
VSILCAEYDPSRPHGELVWRVHDGLPVIEIVNNWDCRTFADSYRSEEMNARLQQVLDIVQPDVVHVHSLLNLSFDLPELVRARGVPVVATLHDYTLVCASGGQRLHRSESHVCHVIEADRCARCFRESEFYTQMSVAPLAKSVAASSVLQRSVGVARKWAPGVLAAIGESMCRTGPVPVTAADIRARLERSREVFREVDVFVAPSASIAEEFRRLGLPHEKVRVADYGFGPISGARGPDGPAEAGPYVPAKAGPLVEPLRIGFVGTLVWHKGVHMLLAAARRLPPSRYQLLIHGDLNTFTEYVAGLRRAAAGLPIQFCGRFESGGAGEVYSALDVLVVPSLWLENSPLVIHEAFMCGVPVVGARIGGIAELIEDGVNGRLYDPASDFALAEILTSLVSDPSQLERWRAALPAVKSMDEDAKHWESIYAELVACHSPAGRP